MLGAPVKGDVAMETEGSAGARMLSWYGPTSTRLTSGDATDALNRSSQDELEGRIMGKAAQEGVAPHSSAHKQIAHGSTRARLASDTSARIAMPRRLARHQLRERLDRPRRHPQLHLYHLSPRRALVTNICCISSPSWTLSLCCRQSNGSQEDCSKLLPPTEAMADAV